MIAPLIFWLAGGLVALLGQQKIREYKDYSNPKVYLIGWILLCFFMSWALVLLLLMNGEYVLPSWLFHNCKESSSISYEEEYFDKDGNKVDGYPFAVHHTYRVYTCRKCGKVTKEQMQ